MPLDATIASPATTACVHCGLPAPLPDDNAPAFCCHGCEAAYSLIATCGLDRYYALRDTPEHGELPSASDHTYAEMDDRGYHARHVIQTRDGLHAIELSLPSMHCGACMWLLERLPRLVRGVAEARVNLRQATLLVRWDNHAVPLSRIARTLDTLGYPARALAPDSQRLARIAANRRDLVHIGVAGACAGNAMLYAVCLYAGLFEGIEPGPAAMFRWLSLCVTSIALAWPGRVFFANAWASLRTRTPHLDLPISFALIAGGGWSLIATLTGKGEVYFDSLSVLVFILLAGRYLQKRRQQAGSDAVAALFTLTPTRARRVEGNSLREVPIESLALGDVIEVRAGDSLPADGVILSGDSSIDQSLLTGESRPASIGVGSRVCAGTVNLGDVIRVRVDKTGDATRLAGIVRLVEQAALRRAPIVLFADRLAGLFTVGMPALAAIVAITWLFIDPSRSVELGVALLVVTCPCALGLATPLTLVVGLGRAARQGLLIKGGDVIQRVAESRLILLDKTGTLTLGRPSVRAWEGDESLRPLVAALEGRTAHPVAQALREGYEHIALHVEKAIHTTGAGVTGVVAGRTFCVGSPVFVARTLVPHEAASMLARTTQIAREGLTPVVVGIDGVLGAIALLGDDLRPEAADAVARLHALGLRVGILSGDHPSVVDAVARRAGIDASSVVGGLSPEDKVARVQQARGEGRVVFVGDGVNDAAALAAADVGVAVQTGAEAALAAADVYIARRGLAPLVDLVVGSRTAMRTIRQNLVASFIYNVLAVTGTLLGFVTPLLAALIMPMSSITVLSVALRSRTFREASPIPPESHP